MSKQSKRFYHYVKSNANSETIHNCIFVDCETNEIQLPDGHTGHILRFGWSAASHRNSNGIWTKPDWKKFTTYDDFWLWTLSHCRAKHKTWIWCHNSNFDYPVLKAFSHLQDIGFDLVSAIIDGPPTIVRYRSPTPCDTDCILPHHSAACKKLHAQARTIILCDTLNIWRMSLATLGKKVGLEKLEHDLKWSDSDKDDEYCRRDVEIIMKAVTDWTDWLKQNDMGGFVPTVAGQAMRSFRHKWMRDKILIDANELSLKLARKCYHGGRCEAGYIGELHQPVHSLDINSAYPDVMSRCQMPLRLVGISRFVQVYQLRKLLEKYCICGYFRVNTNEPFAAIVREGKLCFPVGTFDAFLSTPEIEYAVERGYLSEVHLCASYEKGVAFRDFALDLYDHKERATRSGNLIEASHWKLLLNSFYGKWGQAGRRWEKVGVCDRDRFGGEVHINAQTRKITNLRYFAGTVFERSPDTESKESHPAIAAHICAHVRMILWTLIRQVPAKDYFYCDTDGLLVSDHGLQVLNDRIDQHRLGYLKHIKTYSDVRIYGCKDLVLDGKEVLKGIRPNAIKLKDGKFRQLKWTGLRGLLAAGRLDMPLTITINKTLSRVYTKGAVGLDGYVTPFHLEGTLREII